jgi:hypothetical protein
MPESQRRAPRTFESDAFAALAAALWSERDTLETLLFKLVEEQLVLTGGVTRWLNRADDEVRAALDRVCTNEVMRAAEVDGLVWVLGLPAETTLAELAELAPEPWGEVLSEHRTALRTLAFEIQAATAENRRLLHAGAESIRETLDTLSRSVSTYDAHGEVVRAAAGPFLLDAQV